MSVELTFELTTEFLAFMVKPAPLDTSLPWLGMLSEVKPHENKARSVQNNKVALVIKVASFQII